MSSFPLETILIEEIPLSDQHLHTSSLLPSSIYEQDDPRSLLYMLESEPFEEAVAAIREAQTRHQQQQQEQLERLMEEEMLLDAIGRRLLAVNGYDVPDLWRGTRYQMPQPGYYSSDVSPFAISATQTCLSSGDLDNSYRYAPASTSADPFIHTVPILLDRDRRPSVKQEPGVARIAIHPVTGLPVLNTQELDFYAEQVKQALNDEDDVADAELDCLGREILLAGKEAGVWVIDADLKEDPLSHEPFSFQVIEYDDAEEQDQREKAKAMLHQAAQEASAPTSSPPRFTSEAASTGGRARATTVMSESEEEELETVGKAKMVSKTQERPKKTVKVVDTRNKA